MTGSALRLVGPVSGYCDKVRQWVWPTVSVVSVAARIAVRAHPSVRYTSMSLGREETKTQPMSLGDNSDWRVVNLKKKTLCTPGPL